MNRRGAQPNAGETQAGITLILGVEETLAAAEEAGITVVGIQEGKEGGEISVPVR